MSPHGTVESLLTGYESGRVSRRELVLSLTALAAAPLTSRAQSDVLKAQTLNHVSLIVSDLDRSVAFYQRLFGLPVKSRQTGGVNLGVGDGFVGVYQGRPMPSRTSITFASGCRISTPKERWRVGLGRRAGRVACARWRAASVLRRSGQSARATSRRELLRRTRPARESVSLDTRRPGQNHSRGRRTKS